MASKQLPLKGVRIVDLSTVLAGPYCTMILADLGAEVIKIENHKGGILAGDFSRIPARYHVGGIGAYFLAVNRNKKSIGIDLTTENGRKVFHDIVRLSDVVYDNSRPTALAKMGADYETLKKIKDDIICCSLSGYGKTGPYARMPAYDITVQARGGSMSITGEEGRPPVRMGLAMGDLAGSLFSATAIVSALLNREKTGNGTMLDISLLDCQVSLLTYLSEYFLVGGLVPGPQGSGHETLIPYRAFKAKDYYLTLACFNEKHWGALCEAICEGTGCDDIKTNPKFCNAMTRNLNKDEVNQELERVLLTKTVEEWGTIFDKNNIPWGPVNTIDRALSDPQVLARNMVVDIKHPVEGTYKTVGNPIKIHDMVEEFNPVPLVGQQTREFLTDILKYHNDIVDQLFKEGIVGEQTPADLEEIQKIFKPLMNIK